MNSSILEFQNFDLDSPTRDETTRIDVKQQKSQSFANRSQRASPDPSDNDSAPRSNKSFWTFEYYQQFFDVNTDEVKARIIWSMVPSSRKNYLETYIKPNPDLYGPIWICTTLIFTIAVSGNVANYLQYAPTGSYHWRYDFHLISYAATAIFSYAFLVPLGLYTFMRWNSTEVSLSFLELLCAYGYSLAIYVPVSILSVIQISWFQWGLILVATTLSAFVLVTSVSPSIDGPKKIPMIALVTFLHFLLAVGFMLYFFHVPDVEAPVPSVAPTALHEAVAQIFNKTQAVTAGAVKAKP